MPILLAMALALAPAPEPTPTPDRPTVLVVVGTPGSEEYGREFHRWASLWQAAAAKGSADCVLIGEGPEGNPTDRDRLRAALAERAGGTEPLWLVLIGHGTFDGREAKINLRGPDATDAELLEWLKPMKRPVAVLDCTAASGPFVPRLSGPNRIIATATRSGDEQNYARFGQYLAESIGDPGTDLDKDGQVSLLEAFLVASGRVAEFYRSKSRLATEHPILDDNGDRLGTPADFFRGVHATKQAKAGAQLDGPRAHQLHLIPSDRERRLSPEGRRRRDELELAITALRVRKQKLPEAEYYRQLEALMLELGRIYVPSSTGSSGR
ncbi:hypothetical protein OJF2_49540 [Aquisphaera giovannonii]|uniref:Caspase domain protein n=1 Tax=Aquisphaera giovannonii TaxID=406548 RepID=A0A5B9W8P3_9BACT|nr:hypothetical protein [Aquisphaera giovannonii]QEH36391.1 hypothetical protein OJF2_49540 [Aquisphaera giovannonii]